MPDTPFTRRISPSASNMATWLDDMQTARRTGTFTAGPSYPAGSGSSSRTISSRCSTPEAPCQGSRMRISVLRPSRLPEMSNPDA